VCALPRRTVPAGRNPARRLSLQPEALGAAQEVTNELKHFEKRPRRGPAIRAGRSAQRTSSRPREIERGCRPTTMMGKAAAAGEASDTRIPQARRGSNGSTHGRKGRCATREVWSGEPSTALRGSTSRPRGKGSAWSDGGCVRSTSEAGQCRWREGALTRNKRGKRQEPGD
jgi:hypothetical protein